MKKKIALFVSIFFLIAAGGGLSLLYTVEHNTFHLNELILLHEVEIHREQLALSIYQVQKDLYSLSSNFPESNDAIKIHLSKTETAMNSCFECHHDENVLQRISDLRDQVFDYGRKLKNALAVREDERRFQEARDQTLIIGESLTAKIDTMIVLTSSRLRERTEGSLENVNRSRTMIILLVIAGPLTVALFSFMTMNSFSRPIRKLLAAVQRLKSGDLDSRVEGLTDEFAELSTTFNDMAGALREYLQEIRDSERRYRLLFEGAADAIFILEAEGDRAGSIVAANHAAADMHGFTVGELQSMRIQELDVQDAARDFPKRLERMLQGERVTAQINHRRKDGTVFPVEISAALFETGHHRYILAIDRDLTERQQAAELLQRADQLRLTGELATGLAHEIKNPLAGIKVTMETLADEKYLAAEDRDLLHKVVDEIRRIDSLVKGLLNFARPPRPHFIATDINVVIESAAQLALQNRRLPAGGAAAIDLIQQFAQDLPEIVVDPLQIKQVFVNLIMNAVEAMPRGGTLVLKTLKDEASSAVTVRISDTGQGMDPAVLNRLFQPFFTTKAKGNGLGLAISKRLIEEQGGRISAESEAGKGTMFTVTLPHDARKGADRK